MFSLALMAFLSAQANTSIPPSYQDLYSSLVSYLQSFGSEINSGWDRTSYPVAYAGQLATASSNIGPKLIDPDYYANAVVPDLNQMQALGVKAVDVPIDYPILDPGFYSDPADYQAYVNFYIRLAADIRSRGLKMITETSPTFSQPGFTPWNVAPYYASLTQDQYQRGRARQAATIAQIIKPDYLTVITEPDTEADQTGFPPLGTVDGSTAMLNQILAYIRQSGAKGVAVGAGVGSWMPAYQSWFDNFAAAGVQYLDIHVFAVNRDFLTQLPEMADYAAKLGKPIASTQLWLNKERDSELGAIDYGQVAGRDPFSFWQPLDVTFLRLMVNFACWKHALFISPFWTPYFHAYLDYDSTAGMNWQDIVSQAMSEAAQNISSAQYTSTGMLYGAAVTKPTNTSPPSAPAGLSATVGYTTAHLTWNASSDAVGVAGYVIFRNGARIATTAFTDYYDLDLTEATTYYYTVAAYDATLRTSPKATPLVITTYKH
jgi:hypothetical protein